jgi:transmembrane sensor
LECAWEEAQRLRALGAGTSPGVVPPPGQWRVSPLFESRQPLIEPDGVGACGSGDGADEAQPSSNTSIRWRARRRTALAMAAVLLMAVGAGAYLSIFWSADRYSTPVGGISSISLQDGSNITLDTASKVRVTLTKEARRIELESGEAFFEVAPDPTRPFTVTAGDKRVIAVGTKFSVRRDRDDLAVAVTEGTVRLEDSSAPLRVNGTAEASALLPAGTVAQAANTEVRTEKRTPHELDETLSWRAGYLIFDAEPLSRAIAEFNRYTTRKIVIADPDVGTLPISGKFRATNAQAFTRMLHEGFAISVEERDESIVLGR